MNRFDSDVLILIPTAVCTVDEDSSCQIQIQTCVC